MVIWILSHPQAEASEIFRETPRILSSAFITWGSNPPPMELVVLQHIEFVKEKAFGTAFGQHEWFVQNRIIEVEEEFFVQPTSPGYMNSLCEPDPPSGKAEILEQMEMENEL
jgi:hypothetical protein